MDDGAANDELLFCPVCGQRLEYDLSCPAGCVKPAHEGDFPELDAAPEVTEAQMAEWRRLLSEMVSDLDPRERKVIELRFGLVDGHPRTLEEVGREFGVTRDRIRQIESKTLCKLRGMNRLRRLEGWLE